MLIRASKTIEASLPKQMVKLLKIWINSLTYVNSISPIKIKPSLVRNEPEKNHQ